MITFYLVRHGEAECNVLGVASSVPETIERHLTEKGKGQIVRVAESLVDKKIDSIIASPLARTQETARIISEKIGISVETDDRLHETGFGVFNERPIRFFFEKYPDPDMRISPDPADGVESYIDMRGRLTSFLDDVKERYAGKTIVIVSHGDPLEQLHGILTDEAPGVSATGWYPEKGSCTKIEFQW